VLRQEAEGIIRELGLLELLNRYGDARVVGSVALDLIVKLDIDIHLLVAADDLLAVVDSVYHQLLDRPRVREVRITDYRAEGAVKIGIDRHPGPSGTWSLDLWITNRIETTAFATVERLRRELRPDHRRAILAIKRHYDRQGLLRDGLSSRIYEAVLDGGVRTVEAFEAYAGTADGRGGSAS
jgi:hypothetical protein